jgi:hypothetical protein
MNIFLEPNMVFRVVGPDEPLLENYLVRSKYEDSDGGWNTTYKNKEWRGTAWHTVSEDLPGWINRTIRGYCKFAKGMSIEEFPFEVIEPLYQIPARVSR